MNSKILKRLFALSGGPGQLGSRLEGLRRSRASVKGDRAGTAANLSAQSLLIGRLLSNQVRQAGLLHNLHDAEFRVFSQWGDDGIIQYLINTLEVQAQRFIEFGVEDYKEANTRFLLLNDNWSGLVIDGADDNVARIKQDEIYWKYDLTALPAFVIAENINQLIANAGFGGELGLLHIDVDGNDYWIWKAIEVVDPVIAIIEYNSLFGCERAITVPYDPVFSRFTAHHSGIYAGASLPALCDLAAKKGYAFIGSNSAGNNAYFVRQDRLRGIRPLSPQQGYVASKFREHRDAAGALTFLSGSEAIKRIRGMHVFNTRTNCIETL